MRVKDPISSNQEIVGIPFIFSIGNWYGWEDFHNLMFKSVERYLTVSFFIIRSMNLNRMGINK